MLGCESNPVADGTTCDDGDACTMIDTCTSGVCAGTTPTLGDDPQGNLDQDIWTFFGTGGENVSITLAAQDSNNQGRANLILVQDGGGLSITDHTDLPNSITVDLPANGTYIIAVTQQGPDDLLPGNPFTGAYCLDAPGVTLTPDASVEP